MVYARAAAAVMGRAGLRGAWGRVGPAIGQSVRQLGQEFAQAGQQIRGAAQAAMTPGAVRGAAQAAQGGLQAVGKAAVPGLTILGAGYDALNGMANGETPARAVGGASGSVAGAMLGARIPGPIWAKLLGAGVGGFVGGWAADRGADAVANQSRLGAQVFGNRRTQGSAAPTPSQSTPYGPPAPTRQQASADAQLRAAQTRDAAYRQMLGQLQRSNYQGGMQRLPSGAEGQPQTWSNPYAQERPGASWSMGSYNTADYTDSVINASSLRGGPGFGPGSNVRDSRGQVIQFESAASYQQRMGQQAAANYQREYAPRSWESQAMGAAPQTQVDRTPRPAPTPWGSAPSPSQVQPVTRAPEVRSPSVAEVRRPTLAELEDAQRRRGQVPITQQLRSPGGWASWR